MIWPIDFTIDIYAKDILEHFLYLFTISQIKSRDGIIQIFNLYPIQNLSNKTDNFDLQLQKITQMLFNLYPSYNLTKNF